MGNCCLAVRNEVKAIEDPYHAEAVNETTPTTEPPSLKVFSLAELKIATGCFKPESLVGEGGFGKVYKGYVDEKTYAPVKPGGSHGIPVAVKKSKPGGEQGLKEWKAEVKFLGSLKHPNLVRLLGFCWEDKQFLLVYEFMHGGSLEYHLFSETRAIPWDTRMKIAVGAATGLAFLHSTGNETVIYRDFKASNILLDQEFNAKISDFGLAKLGPPLGRTHVTTQIMGTHGYAAPEYVATGHLYVKSDVYSFGVVLLEIITGCRVYDTGRPGHQMNLVDWAKPMLRRKKKLEVFIDPRLDGRYPSKGAHLMAKLIFNCLEPDPRKRPAMEDVLNWLKDISSIKVKPRKSSPTLDQDR